MWRKRGWVSWSETHGHNNLGRSFSLRGARRLTLKVWVIKWPMGSSSFMARSTSVGTCERLL